MSIRCIYSQTPNFPPTDQDPGAVRGTIAGFVVDYTGAPPTNAEVLAIMTPSPAQIQTAIREGAKALFQIQDGGNGADMSKLLRAIVGLVTDEINTLRAFHALPARTLAQVRNAILAKIDVIDP